MTIELYVNPLPFPLSYEGVEIPIHVIIHAGDFIAGEGWCNHYDCNVIHAVNTLRGMGHEVEGVRFV